MQYTHKPVDELSFTDDFIFGTVMKNKMICKGVIERLLHIKVGKIEYPSLQKTIAPFYESKGIRLDVYVSDSERVFDIEIQTSIPPSLPKRTRYYQSLMDVDNLLRGQSYAELKASCVIFICTQEPFGEGLPVYTFRSVCGFYTVMTAAPVFSSFGSRAESPSERTAILSPEKRRVPDAGTASVNPSGLHA